MRKLLSKLSIKNKILTLTAPPLLIIFLTVAVFIYFEVEQIREGERTAQIVEASLILDGVAHNFAVERGLTAGFLGSGGQNKDKLIAQRKKAQQAKLTFLSYLEENRASFNEKVKRELGKLESQLAEVDKLRVSVDTLNPENSPFTFYSNLNKQALQGISLLADTSKSAKLAHELNLLVAMLWLKERSGQERGLLNGIFAKSTYTLTQMSHLTLFQAEQETQLDQIKILANERQLGGILGVLNSTAGKLVNDYRTVFEEAVSTNGAFEISAGEWFVASTNRIKGIKGQSDLQASNIVHLSDRMAQEALTYLIITIAFLFITLSFLIYLSQVLAKQLTSGISALTNGLQTTYKTSQFSTFVSIHTEDELGEAGAAFNHLCEKLSGTFSGVNRVMGDIAKGDFSARVEFECEGDLEQVKHAVNQSAKRVEVTMDGLSTIMLAMKKGDFGVRMSNEVEGPLRKLVDESMTAMEESIKELCMLMEQIQHGNFSGRMARDQQGALAKLKVSVNNGMNSLEGALSELVHALRAQKKGDFECRMEGSYQGDLADLKYTFNSSSESVNSAIGRILDVFSNIKQGDYEVEVTGEFEGALAQLKTDTNLALKALNSAINEILFVARAQRDGRLEMRIKGDYKGQLESLKTALNDSGNSLESVVSDISDICCALREGKFDSQLSRSMSGEFGMLKVNLNSALSNLSNAVKDIKQVASSQQKGDLFITMPTDYEGDLKDIAVSLNSSTDKLKSIFINLKQSSTQTLGVADDQAYSASQVAESSASQAASLEQVSASMDEIRSTVEHTAHSCIQMTDKTNHAKAATEGAMNVVQSTVDVMRKMKESSKQIEQITGMIDEIAFQTNLLALNASVEAARAGEQGLGFSVVAGEVRELAQRSANAAKQIKGLIQENMGQVEESFDWCQESRASLDDIVKRIADSSLMMEQISQAANEQTQTIAEINEAVSAVDNATQKNAATAERMNSGMMQVKKNISEVDEQLSFFNTEKEIMDEEESGKRQVL